MPKVQISSPKLRQPNGVFSHATAIEATGRLVFISGMTARRPDGTRLGGRFVEGSLRIGGTCLSVIPRFRRG